MQTINKKRFSFSMLFTLLALIGMSVSFVACSDDDDSSDEVVLNSFGPSPVALGGMCTFIGQNLDQITAIEFPGYTVEKADFESQTANRIEVIVTRDTTKAMVGPVTLVYSDGTVTSKTSIGYRQTCIIDAFSPAAVKPGKELTISGAYMSSVKSVVFEGATVSAEDFVSQDNATIVVTVPMEATSGLLAVNDGTESIYAADELVVTAPTVSSISPKEDVYPGETEVTIAGTDLDLVTSISFANGYEMDATGFKAAEKAITFTYPAEGSGILTLHTANGTAVAADANGNDVKFALVTPVFDYFGYNGTDEAVTDGTVYKLGSEVKLTGENLDLVKSVLFGAGSTTDFTVSDDGKVLLVKIPGTATSDNSDQKTGHLPMDEAHAWGRLYSGWQNGFVIKAESSASDTLFVGYAYAEWGPCSVWGSMELNAEKTAFKAMPGSSEDNEFITKVTLDGVDYTDAYKAGAGIEVPLKYVLSCPFNFEFTNGASKACDAAKAEPTAASQVNFPIVTSFPEGKFAGNLVEVTGYNFSTSTEFTFVSKDGTKTFPVTDKGFNNSKSYYITLPAALSGTYTLIAKDSNGSSSYEGCSVAGSQQVLFEGSHALNWDKTLGGWDLTGVSKLQIYVSGDFGGWIGFLFQNAAGENIWSAQKDYGNDLECLEITGSDIPTGTDWFICGGTSGSCTITKVVAVF